MDPTPSLSVRAASNGHALLWCFAECRSRDVLAALGLQPRHLFHAPVADPHDWLRACGVRIPYPPVEANRGGHPAARGLRLEAIHQYGPDARMLRWRHPTTGDKDPRWERLAPDGTWIPGPGGRPQSDLPLYREPDLWMAFGAREPIVVVESESSADALCGVGIYSTTWAGGAASPNLDRLRGILGQHRPTVLCPDNDPAGLACLALLRGALPHAAVVLPDPGEDARDLLGRLGPDLFLRHRKERAS